MNNYIVDNLMMERYVPQDISPKVVQSNNKRMAILSFLSEDRLSFKTLLENLRAQPVHEVTHLGKIHDLLTSYITFTEKERDKYSIANTPLNLAFEVLDRLPGQIWHDPNSTFLDPGCGSGIFPLVMIYKLMDGLQLWETDSEKRYKHIVENMIYVSDILPNYIFQYQCLVDPFELYSTKTYCGSSVDAPFKKHIQNEWKIQKFTAIVGMPPFAFRKYVPFITPFIGYTQYMAYIVSSKLTLSQTESNHFEGMKKNGLNHITFIDKGNYPGSLNYMYFIMDTQNTTKYVNINDIAYPNITEPLHNYRSKLDHSIMVKIDNLWKVELDRGRNEPVSFKDSKETKLAKNSPSNEYPIRMLARLGGGKKLEYNYIREDKNKTVTDKLVFPRSGGGVYNNPKTYKNLSKHFAYNLFVDKNTPVSDSLMFVHVRNRIEAQYMSWYIAQSIWVRYVFLQYNNFEELSMMMFSNFIPVIPLDKMMNDDDIFALFKFTDSEIQHIKNVVL